MRTIFFILAIIITLFVLFFGEFNEIPLNLALFYTNITFKTTFFAITGATYALGMLAGVLLMMKGVFEGAKQTKKIKRQLEKVSIGADDSGLKVKTLENKIETLEIALKKALENKEQN